jgi:outer membrane biosynthesis protein TonB
VILLELKIGTDGHVETTKRLRPSNEDKELSEAAIRAVKKWRFARTWLNAAAISVIRVLSIRFPPD